MPHTGSDGGDVSVASSIHISSNPPLHNFRNTTLHTAIILFCAASLACIYTALAFHITQAALATASPVVPLHLLFMVC